MKLGRIATLLTAIFLPTIALAEGTAQLGANQDVREDTLILVDILTAGEVINIAVGNDSNQTLPGKDTSPVEVFVLDPTGTAVAGSPFTIKPGQPGFLDVPDQMPPASLYSTNLLQIITTATGTYQIEFNNTKTFQSGTPPVVDPLDITVTQDAATPVTPANPPNGLGRIHTKEWLINGHGFVVEAATNASFYTLAPTGPSSDVTWRLQFADMAGYIYEIAGNDIGLPAPNSSFSEDENKTSVPLPMYEIYLNVPQTAKGGGQSPKVTNFRFNGPSTYCTCAVNGLQSTFTFDSDSNGTYALMVDIDNDGFFDPSKGDVLLSGNTQTGSNTVIWDGKKNNGQSVSPGNYAVRLSVRVGEFHFVAKDIETAKPGLRIFAVDVLDKKNLKYSATQMYWNDTRINTLDHFNNTIPQEEKSDPVSTLPDGLSSGSITAPTQCGGTNANAHCWGNFTNNDKPPSPGNSRYIDTWVFSHQHISTSTTCVKDGTIDDDQDNLTMEEECTAASDPTKSDTDNDGIIDGTEAKGSNPTDPTKSDSDDDGISDGIEDANQNGIFDEATETDPTKADTDSDGLVDGIEDANKNGKIDDGETDPKKNDTDEDGLFDGIESGKDADGNEIVGANPTNPLKKDTDDDGLLDNEEDKNKDGIFDIGNEETDPSNNDTDEDGLLDGIESGKDSNGNDIEGANITKPLVADSDQDGLLDGNEDINKNGKYEKETETDPNHNDTDSDGLVDGIEDANQNGKIDDGETDPKKADTDNGGENDSDELKHNHNPLNPNDDRPPGAAIWGGGGCSLSPKSNTGVITVFVLLVLFCIFRRKNYKLFSTIVVFFILGNQTITNAAPIQFPVVNFKPAASPLNFYVTESGLTLPHLSPSISIYGNYAHRPLEMVDTQNNGNHLADVIKNQINLDVLISIGFWNRLELGIAIPVTVMQSSDDLTYLDHPAGSILSAGLGDMSIIPKLRIHTAGVATLAISTPFSIPIGNKENFLGESGVSFSPRIIFFFDTDYFDFALNVGYRLRHDQSIAFSNSQETITIDDEIFGSAGFRIALWKDHLDLLADGLCSMSIFERQKEEIPAEIIGGLRAYFPYGFSASLGGGAGITKGIGTPAFRILANVSYYYKPKESKVKIVPGDPDLDGIMGEKEKCPNEPEDFDRFEDEDGCPEKDNDKDGILDGDDVCANEPEDKDGFKDEDGCPDLDNDNDGITDKYDKCPNELEDRDGFEDEDGCPDLDNDNDGITDKEDKCPDRPEDKDGMLDEDGCPDLDNDNDGITDKEDKCPNEPEDKNNVEDEDGCPEKDRDHDGISDNKDKCPDQPETFNNVNDEDGCPDLGPGKIQIQHGKITVPPVFFATGRDRILPLSFPVLRTVATILKDNKWIKKIQIEGHTDSQGNDLSNLKLSQRRAASVRLFLIQNGVDNSRLISEGYGETKPIASNRTKQGRAKNRRVEFIILDPPHSQN